MQRVGEVAPRPARPSRGDRERHAVGRVPGLGEPSGRRMRSASIGELAATCRRRRRCRSPRARRAAPRPGRRAGRAATGRRAPRSAGRRGGSSRARSRRVRDSGTPHERPKPRAEGRRPRSRCCAKSTLRCSASGAAPSDVRPRSACPPKPCSITIVGNGPSPVGRQPDVDVERDAVEARDARVVRRRSGRSGRPSGRTRPNGSGGAAEADAGNRTRASGTPRRRRRIGVTVVLTGRIGAGWWRSWRWMSSSPVATARSPATSSATSPPTATTPAA